ncbi:MAG: Fe-S cluster assembly ATPase SufC [Lachnospiraceae bacterium]|nr:Fe-S cluster assembly ATPase SufC [Lachnospiraceae bacterium]
MTQLLKVENLKAKVEETEILKGINLEVNEGEVHVILGPNGAGKSTLGSAIIGSPEYEKTDGKIIFKGEDITEQSADKIAKLGMFLTFQNPIEVPGISMSNFIKNALEQRNGQRIRLWDFKKQLKETMEVLQIDESYADRDLNVGFSGGEKKKAEILQMLMLKPDLAILDETDSGLDVDAVHVVSKGIEKYRSTIGGALIIITHSTRILESLKVDKTHIIVDGRVVCEGGSELIDEVNKNGFEKYEAR